MDERELQTKFQVFEQQIMQIQQQLQAIDQAIVEIDFLEKGLDDLIGKKDLEILSPLGKGIFAKTKLLSEELIVDVGGKNFVTKSIPETQELIKEQLTKLNDVKKELEGEMQKINTELTKTMLEFQQNAKMQHDRSCSHDEECEKDCGDDCGNDCKCE